MAARVLARYIADAPAIDVFTTLVAMLCLVGGAMIAAWFPAWEAARMDPTVTLRAE